MLSVVLAKIWCLAVDCIDFMKMFACHGMTCHLWRGALNTSGFEIPKRGVNSAGPFEDCNTGLQRPALGSFSSSLADHLIGETSVTFPSAGQYPNYDGTSSLFPSLSICARCRCRVTPDLSPKWSVSSLWTKEGYLHLILLQRAHSMSTRVVHTVQIGSVG